MPTNREISKLAKVSISTVSLVRNNRENVSEEMRQRVLSAIDQLDRLENNASDDSGWLAQFPIPALKTELFSILIIHAVAISNTDFLGEILNGIHLIADAHGMQLRLVGIDNKADDTHVISRLYLAEDKFRPNGVILIGDGIPVWIEERLAQFNIPCVYAGAPINTEYGSVINPDEIQAGYNATKYLLERGHRKIAFIASNIDSLYMHQRLQGYQRALHEYHIEPHADLIYTREASLEEISALIDTQGLPYSAILFGQSYDASTLLPVIQGKGYAIPTDLSVMVFDDTEFPRAYDPPLTVMSYPLTWQGAFAVKMLSELVSGPWLSRQHILCRPTIIERDSCIDYGE